jgi:hypothetical protein
MKRDMDLVRNLLLEIESTDRILYFSHLSEAVRLRGTSSYDLDYHICLLHEAGLIQALERKGLSSIGPWTVQRLTWDGHEFLDTIRDPEIWSKTKAGAAAAGAWSIGLLKDIGTGYIKMKAKEVLGFEIG